MNFQAPGNAGNACGRSQMEHFVRVSVILREANVFSFARGTMTCSTRRLFFTICLVLVLLLVSASGAVRCRTYSKPGFRIYVTNETPAT